jgi:hypothetical protein
VGAGQHAHFRDDLADRLDVAAVDADAVVEDVEAHDVRLRFLELALEDFLVEALLAVRLGGGELLHHLRLHGVDRGVALGLGGDLVGLAQVLLGHLHDGLLHHGMVRRGEVARLLGGLLGELDDGFQHGLPALLAEDDGAEHDLLGQLLRLRFDHQHGVLGARDHEVEHALVHLRGGRVQHVFAVDVADLRRADRAHEGHAGKREGRGDGDHGEHVGVVLEVMLQHGHDHLRVVAVALREERADRTVDEAGDQRLLLGRPALALEIAAGDAAGGEGLLLVVHGEREEVDARLRLLGGDDGGEHDALAVGRENRAVGLAGDLARLEGQLAAAPVDGDFLMIEHVGLSCLPRGLPGQR